MNRMLIDFFTFKKYKNWLSKNEVKRIGAIRIYILIKYWHLNENNRFTYTDSVILYNDDVNERIIDVF